MVSDADLDMAALRTRLRLEGLLDSLPPEHPNFMADTSDPERRREIRHEQYERAKARVEGSATRSRPREGSASGDGTPLTFSEWEGVVW